MQCNLINRKISKQRDKCGRNLSLGVRNYHALEIATWPSTLSPRSTNSREYDVSKAIFSSACEIWRGIPRRGIIRFLSRACARYLPSASKPVSRSLSFHSVSLLCLADTRRDTLTFVILHPTGHGGTHPCIRGGAPIRERHENMRK